MAMKTETAGKKSERPFRERRLFHTKDGEWVTLRPARASDAPEITKRMARVVKEGVYLEEDLDTMPNGEEHRKEIRSIHEDDGMYTVAEVNGKIAGVAILKRGSMEMNRHTAKFRTWLAPGFRGMGLGKKLMEYTIAWAKANGLEKINLDVFSNNQRAIRLYQKYGFRKEGHLRKQYVLEGEYVDEILMSLFI
jgi:RimJ/RimL family protein N-acetyltransferase